MCCVSVCMCASVCVVCVCVCIVCLYMSVCMCVWGGGGEIHVCDAAKGTPVLSPPELHEVLAALGVHCRKEELRS